MTAHAATNAPADAPEAQEKPAPSGRLLLRMPRTLHAELARRAEQEGTSLNQFITSALASTIGGGTSGSAESEDAGPAARREAGPSPIVVRALIANAVVIGLAGAAAIAVLLVALFG